MVLEIIHREPAPRDETKPRYSKQEIYDELLKDFLAEQTVVFFPDNYYDEFYVNLLAKIVEYRINVTEDYVEYILQEKLMYMKKRLRSMFHLFFVGQFANIRLKIGDNMMYDDTDDKERYRELLKKEIEEPHLANCGMRVAICYLYQDGRLFHRTARRLG